MDRRPYRLPPLELLPTFEAAARHLSFTRAGEELHLTQSAVSRQIRSLEEALGTPLFERKTRALALTEAGLSALHTAQEVLARIDSLLQSLGAASEVRPLTLTTTPGFASLWLIPRLARFTNAHPGVDVRTSATNQLVDLARAGVDLAIRYTRIGSHPDGRRLFDGVLMPVCSPKLLQAAKRPLLQPADLGAYTLLYLEDPYAAWFDWSAWFHALGLADFRPARRLHFSHYDQMIQAAVNAQGIALGLDPLVRDLIRQRKLIAPFKRTAVQPRAWYMVRSPATRGRADVDAFEAWLLDEIRLDQERTGSRRGRAGSRTR